MQPTEHVAWLQSNGIGLLKAAIGYVITNPMATLFSSPHNGERAFQAGDYGQAVKEFLPLAHRGNATAQYYIARMC